MGHVRGRAGDALRGEAGVAAGYLALAAVLLHDALWPGRAFYFRDVYLFWMPSIEGFVRAVGGGEWPLWDPSFSFGKPLLADPGLQLAYPPTWLNLLLLPHTYYELFLLAHLTWGGFGAYRLAKRWGLPAPAARAAGAFFACSGPLVSALSLWHHFAGTTWLPWVLLALERLLDRPGPRRAALLAAAAAGQALAGSADLCLMTAGLCTLRIAAGWRRRGWTPRLGWLAGAAVLAAGIGAVQWLPALATLETSTRRAMGAETRFYWSLHPAQLVELVFPLPISGFALEPDLRERFFEGRDAFLTSIHPGVGVLGLAGLGLLVPGPRRRLRLGLWLAVTALLLASLGRHGFLQSLIGVLPGFDWIRYPQKFLLPASLFFALAAGCGVALWQETWSRSQRRSARVVGAVGGVLGIVLGAGAVVLWTRASPPSGLVVPELAAGAAAIAAPALATAAATALLASGALLARSVRAEPGRVPATPVVALALAQLVLAGAKLCPGAPSPLVTARPDLLGTLVQEPSPRRLQVLPPPRDWIEAHLAHSPVGWDASETRALGRVEALEPPTPARWGVDGAFWGTFTGQELLTFSDLTAFVDERRDALGTQILRMSGVTHVVSVEREPYPGLAEIATVRSVFDRPIRLFRLSGASARAYAVDGVAVAGEPRSYDLLLEGALDLQRSVILPSGVPRVPGEAFRAKVRLLWRRTASVGVEAELSGDGVLVLLEAWDPGWTVEVDGAASPLLRANLLFRGVALEGGRHRVVFRYRPPEVAAGFWISLVAVVGAIGLISRREAGP